MTITAASYDQAVADGAEALARAIESDAGRPVPSCPGWDLAELAGHVGALYTWAGEQVRRRSEESLARRDLPSPPDGVAARAAWLREQAARLLVALTDADDDAPAGRWVNRSATAGFWRRRMAHETVVHRHDAERALGAPSVLDAVLAGDGIDEVCELFVPLSRRKDGWPPPGDLSLVADDVGAQWWIEPEGDGEVNVHRQPPGRPPRSGRFAQLVAPASELFLVCWGRATPSPAMASGDVGLLDHWLGVLGW